jgi:hypothetical protein
MRHTEGSPVEIAETVHTHEIIISAVEAAKRVRAERGEVPEGFINALREQYPEGIPARIVDDFIKARKPVTEPAGNTKGLVIEGGAAAEKKSKTA